MHQVTSQNLRRQFARLARAFAREHADALLAKLTHKLDDAESCSRELPPFAASGCIEVGPASNGPDAGGSESAIVSDPLVIYAREQLSGQDALRAARELLIALPIGAAFAALSAVVLYLAVGV